MPRPVGAPQSPLEQGLADKVRRALDGDQVRLRRLDTGVLHVAGDADAQNVSVRGRIVPSKVLVNDTAQARSALLANVTSAGDTGGRADHFLDPAFPRWTLFGAAPTASQVAMSVLSVSVAAGTAVTLYGQPYTPSGACQVRVKGKCMPAAAGWSAIGISVRDNTTADGSGNGMLAQLDTNSNQLALFSLDAGVYASRATLQLVQAQLLDWFFLELNRDGAGNWSAGWSGDNVLFAVTATFNKAVSATTAALRYSGSAAGQLVSTDFFDVVT